MGSTIGAGVYVLVGTVARERSGPALTVSFLIAGIAAALSAFCYAELASRCPSAGSAYHYSYVCVGEGIAWLVGWALILEYTVGGAAVARGISPNLALLCGGEDNLPAWLLQQELSGTEITIDPCAAVLVILVTLLLCAGIKESAMVQAMVTSANVCVLILVIIAGAVIGFKTDWIGYRQADGYLPFGINGMLGGAATVFFAYIGFDTVASTAEEVKNPQRDLPLGIGISLSICGSLYMLVSAVIVGIVPYSEMDVNTPISTAFSSYGMQWAMYVVSLGAVAALSSTLMGSLLPQPRILMAMARDGLLPAPFLKISKSTLVPIHGTLATGLVAMLMAFFMNVDELSGMVSVGTLLAFALVGVSILILRYVPPVNATDIPVCVPTAVGHSFSPSTHSSSLENTGDSLQMDSETLVATVLASQVPGDVQDGHVPLVSSNASFHGSWVLKENQTFENDTLLGKKSVPRKSDGKRRQAAGLSIWALCIGAVLIAIGACAELLPSWLRWILGLLGSFVFASSSIVLALLEQDEGRHSFGQSGGFICPFVPWLPMVSILINVYLLADLGVSTWLRVGIWLIIGLVVYFIYGMKHSLLSEVTSMAGPSTCVDSVTTVSLY